jgi:UDP-N-acetylmuramoyl-tripeptide--D-alanyl-D-alanine ligase
MLELGSWAEKLHRQIDTTGLDIVYTCGKLSANIPHQEHFPDKAALVKKLKELLRRGDVVLVKGSRGLQMETIVRGLTTGG